MTWATSSGEGGTTERDQTAQFAVRRVDVDAGRRAEGRHLAIGHLGARPAGIDDVAAHGTLAAALFDGEHVAEHGHAGLGHGVGRGAIGRAIGGDRGHHDDRSAVRAKRGEQLSRHVEGAGQVDGDRLVPLFERRLADRALVVDTGRVDQSDQRRRRRTPPSHGVARCRSSWRRRPRTSRTRSPRPRPSVTSARRPGGEHLVAGVAELGDGGRPDPGAATRHDDESVAQRLEPVSVSWCCSAWLPAASTASGLRTMW